VIPRRVSRRFRKLSEVTRLLFAEMLDAPINRISGSPNAVPDENDDEGDEGEPLQVICFSSRMETVTQVGDKPQEVYLEFFQKAAILHFSSEIRLKRNYSGGT